MAKLNFLNWKALVIVYILSVLAFSFSAKANQLTWIPSDNPNTLPKNLRVATGEVAFDLEGNAYLITSNQEVFELVSETIDLSNLDGARVLVKGIEARYNVGPVFKTQSLVPLVDEIENHNLNASLLIVVSLKVLE